jgi:hypothetical protein
MAIDGPSAFGVARIRSVAFTIVALPDKAIAESRERVRSALGAMGLGLPPAMPSPIRHYRWLTIEHYM